jgi:hypothetical protein
MMAMTTRSSISVNPRCIPPTSMVVIGSARGSPRPRRSRERAL